MTVFAVPVLAQAPPRPPALPAIAPAQATLEQTITGLDGPSYALAYGEQAGILAVACEDGTIQTWDKDILLGIRAGPAALNPLRGHQGPVVALAWNGGPLLASAGADLKIILWDMPQGKIAHAISAGGIVRALALTPDGRHLAAAAPDHGIQWIDPANGKLGEKLVGHTDWVTALAFSPDGKVLASGGYDGVVRLWAPADSKKILEIPVQAAKGPNAPPAPAAIVLALAFSTDGKLLAVGDHNGQIQLFNSVSGKNVRSLSGHAGAVTSLAFHPGGTVLASGSKDRTARLWSTETGQPIKSLEGHTAWVEGVAFLGNGTRLASVSADRTVRLWSLAAGK